MTAYTYGRTLLVIVGAGASHDALPTHVEPGETYRAPPLTDQLVDHNTETRTLIAKYPSVQPLVGELRRALRNHSGDDPDLERVITLEQALDEYRGRASYDPNVRQHLAAMRFYLRDLLYDAAESVLQVGGVTNYTSLVTSC